MDDALLYDVASMVYGEMGSEDKDHWRMAASSFFNSIGKDEWKDWTPQEVLQKRYYAVKDKNDPYTWASTKKFPNKDEENKFKKILAFTSAMAKGKEKITDTQFFWTSPEMAKLKKNKSINFDLLGKVGKVGKFHTFKYGNEEKIPFKKAFSQARKEGLEKFNWRGKSYTTKEK